MASINTLIKPTHECNLRCSYCFHEKYGYDNKILDINMLKKYIKLLSEKYSFINLVWHGGEPLMIPLSYYEEIYDYCKQLNSKIIFSIQTNGTLLDQKKINFFKHNNTSIGLCRKKCIDTCEYYRNCYSGCNANALLNNTNISCYIHKNILDEIKKYILESRKNLENMNSNYAKILSKKR